ncbi:MAG: hypothetical protein WB697_19485 [Stellaceae bacterium]
MLRTTIAALAFVAVTAAAGAAFAQDAMVNTASQSTTANASSSFDGVHTDGTGGRAYANGQKTN